MATKNNPGEFDCYKNAEGDEPLFTLLARDIHAPDVIELWALLRKVRLVEEYEEGTVSEEQFTQVNSKVQEAKKCAADMRTWREENIF